MTAGIYFKAWFLDESVEIGFVLVELKLGNGYLGVYNTFLHFSVCLKFSVMKIPKSKNGERRASN